MKHTIVFVNQSALVRDAKAPPLTIMYEGEVVHVDTAEDDKAPPLTIVCEGEVIHAHEVILSKRAKVVFTEAGMQIETTGFVTVVK